MSADKNAQACAQASCNTKEDARAKTVRSRKFMVTFWEKHDFLWDEAIMQYACMCDDQCSEEHNNRWHGHYYVYYKNQRTWKDLKKYFGEQAHIEIPYSNSGAINYIMGRSEHANSKSNMIEKGKSPCDNGKHISVKQALEMTTEDLKNLEDHRDIITIMKVKDMFDEGIETEKWHKNIKVTWITGPSGCGKSLLAQQIIKKEGYKKMHLVTHDDNGFWDKKGIGNGCGVALYDEFRDGDMKAKEFIKFIDYNYHYLNIKGGSVLNCFERIIITSIQHPEYIYSGIKDIDEPRKQWMRRIEVIDLTPKNDDESDDEGILII